MSVRFLKSSQSAVREPAEPSVLVKEGREGEFTWDDKTRVVNLQEILKLAPETKREPKEGSAGEYVIPDEANHNEEKQEPDPEKEGKGRSESSPESGKQWTPEWIARIRARKAALLVPLIGVLILVGVIGTWWPAGDEEPAVAAAMAVRPEIPLMEKPDVRQEPLSYEEVQRRINKAERKQELETPNFAPRTRETQVIGTRPEPIRVQRSLPATQKTRKTRRTGTTRRTKAPSRAEAEAAPVEPEAMTTIVRRTPDGIVVEKVPRRTRKEVPAGLYGPAGFAERKDTPKKASAGGVSLPVGATIEAKLQVGISTAFRSAPVLARVTKEVRKGDSVLLPAGSTLSGRMSAGDDRIFVQIHKAVTPDDQPVSFQGYAISGKLPGIPAKVTVTEESSGDGSYLSRGAVRTAQGALFGVGGSVAHDLVRNVASEGINDVKTEVFQRPARTLELPAGTSFKVVVTGE